MASVLAVVSKAVFEKQGGKALKLGEVWATAAYVSNNAGLKPLADGGSLFLVTVRPPDEQLWLVAVLESPAFAAGGWSAKANATPARDITALLPELKLKSGQGVHAEKGKLGMSLQTPRELAPEDVALLGGKPLAPKPAAPPPAQPTRDAGPHVKPLPDDDARLAELPPATAASLRAVLEEKTYTGALEAGAAALKSVGFPEGEVYAVLSALTPEQRRVAEFFAAHVGIPSRGFAMPACQWTRKAWLRGGRELDALLDGEPIWRAIQLGKDDVGATVVARLPLLQLLEVMVEMYVEEKGNATEYIRGSPLATATVARVTRELGSEAKGWAPGAADRALSIEQEPLRKIPLELKWLVFLSLVRGGVPIEPRWYALLPIALGPTRPETLECIRAIPEAARAEAIIGALGTILPWDAAVAAISLSEEFPSEALTRWAFDHAGDSAVRPKRKMLQDLAEVAKKQPVVAETLAKLTAKQKPPLVLHFQDLREPKSDQELSASERKQLEAAGKRYDSKKLSAAERLADVNDEDAGSFLGFVEVWTVTDGKDKPVYDAFLYMVDSGTVFKRGTTTAVADVIQGGVGCKDERLGEALEVAIHDRPRPEA